MSANNGNNMSGELKAYRVESEYEVNMSRFSEVVKANKEGRIVGARIIKRGTDCALVASLGGGLSGVIEAPELCMHVGGRALRAIAASLVGKVVAVKVKSCNSPGEITLSRKDAQVECFEKYIVENGTGTVIPAKVVNIADRNVYCDIGCGISGVLPIYNISMNRVAELDGYMSGVTDMFVIIKKIEGNTVYLSHKELLGTWEHQVANIKIKETVLGIVREKRSNCMLIELNSNLTGIADDVGIGEIGDTVAVDVVAINPARMKVKLFVLHVVENVEKKKTVFNYVTTSGKLTEWVYSPAEAERTVVSEF